MRFLDSSPDSDSFVKPWVKYFPSLKSAFYALNETGLQPAFFTGKLEGDMKKVFSAQLLP